MQTPPITTQSPSLSPAVVTTQPHSSSSVVRVRQSCCQMQTVQHCCERTCQRAGGATLGATLGAALGACCGATCVTAAVNPALPIGIVVGTCATVGAVTGAACDRPIRHQVQRLALCCSDSCNCTNCTTTTPSSSINHSVIYTVSEDAARIRAETQAEGNSNHGFVADDEQ